jgi:Zn-dependent M28 family amino/carboxypeptidase
MSYKTPMMLACLGLLAGCNAARTARDAAAGSITEPVYRGYVETLASDEFEGRAPGSAGERKTVQYLEQQFLALGLQPVQGGSFRQEVPLVGIFADPKASYLDFERAGHRLSLALGDDMVVGTRRVKPAVTISASDVVFVGYGIVAPEYGWNDYAGLDMHGKTALILVNDPGFATGDPALFHGRTMTYYGRWTYKFEEAARQGAAAAIIVHETAPAAYPWQVVRNGWTGPQFYAEPEDGNAGRCAIEGWITHERAAEIMALAGQDLASLEREAVVRGFHPLPLDLKASAGVSNTISHERSANVAAILPGKDQPDEYVVYTAHWDHFGKLETAEGDNIFNGAQDNATGVAGILTIAHGFRAMLSAPSRSVIFMATTGEEAGLLGSEYYAAHPLVPLEKTAAVINLDLLSPMGRARDIEVIGYGASELEDRLAAAAARQGRVLLPDANPEAGYFYRSDQLNMARKGVPALFVRSGIDLIGKPPGTGKAMVRDYYANVYHKQVDEYRPEWDVSGSIEDLKLLFEVGAGVAQDGGWPNWYEGNEFRAARDASAASRKAAP